MYITVQTRFGEVRVASDRPEADLLSEDLLAAYEDISSLAFELFGYPVGVQVRIQGGIHE